MDNNSHNGKALDSGSDKSSSDNDMTSTLRSKALSHFKVESVDEGSLSLESQDRDSLQEVEEIEEMDGEERDQVEHELTTNSNYNTKTSNSRPKFSINVEDENGDTVTTLNSIGNNNTMDRPPHIDHYRMTVQALKNRPSMLQLMHTKPSVGRRLNEETSSNCQSYRSERDLETFQPSENVKKEQKKKLGAFEGVYIPSFTNIVGTLLYIRMGWVTGKAGIVGGLGIVTFSTFVISITALSLAGICSNGQQRKGGVYYVVSRALGPQFGGVIGVIFSLANVGMAALYIVGNSEFIVDLMIDNQYELVTGDKYNDIRLFSVVLCIVLMLIAFAGPKVENGFTLIFFSTYYISYFNWLIGTFLPPDDEQQRRGVTGYSWITFEMNLLPEENTSWSTIISTFTVFFPGFTGMLAACMYVDELRNPGRDVPAGLFSCIVSTFVMYVAAVIACGASVLRHSTGVDLPVIDNSTGYWLIPNCSITTCDSGLNHDHQVAKLTSAWPPLIVIGMFGMTISSTMTNLDQGPITFHAACTDRIFPYTKYFAADIKRPYVMLATLTALLTLIGDLDLIDEIVTAMFMAIYVVVNYACFDASFARTPGWRPMFPYYNMWVSLFGAILCIGVMFIVSIVSSIVIVIVFACCLGYFHYFHPEVNWGDTNQAHMYRNALTSLQKLTYTEIHVKNYRPQILLMSGNPASRVGLLDFAHGITKGDSLLMCVHIVPYPQIERVFEILRLLVREIECWLKESRLKAFYLNLANLNLRTGMQNVFQLAGLGKLKPNVLLIGFKSEWKNLEKKDVKEVNDYVGILRDAFENNYGVGILRNCEDGFDLSDALLANDIVNPQQLRRAIESRVHIDEDLLTQSSGQVSELFEPTHVVHRHINRKHNINIPGITTKGQCHQQHEQHSEGKEKRKFFSDRWMFALNKKIADSTVNTTSQFTNASKIPVSLSIDDLQSRSTRRISDSFEIPAFMEHYHENKSKQKVLASKMNTFHKAKPNARIDVWWLYDDGGLTLLLPHLLRLPKSYLEGAQLRVITLSGNANAVDEKSMLTLLAKFRIECNSVKVLEIAHQKLHPDITRKFNALVNKWKYKPEGTKYNRDGTRSSKKEKAPFNVVGAEIHGGSIGINKPGYGAYGTTGADNTGGAGAYGTTTTGIGGYGTEARNSTRGPKHGTRAGTDGTKVDGNGTAGDGNGTAGNVNGTEKPFKVLDARINAGKGGTAGLKQGEEAWNGPEGQATGTSFKIGPFEAEGSNTVPAEGNKNLVPDEPNNNTVPIEGKDINIVVPDEDTGLIFKSDKNKASLDQNLNSINYGTMSNQTGTESFFHPSAVPSGPQNVPKSLPSTTVPNIHSTTVPNIHSTMDQNLPYPEKMDSNAPTVPQSTSPPPHDGLITDQELNTHKRKTYRQLITHQLLIKHSYDASLIVVTLPVPQENIGSCLYMAWLDLMTADLPPTLLVRGNQSSVLTFYS
ncbi:unnamed protein product [Bursaphelenchus okinawaensis]|uniref:Uncharacterized protein n=1 Tax=Bursaphelenchus okinawaensis TaxID=465554 RepID=A0A811JW42_9BILA|nr:unnamed protein product [Bursaphelenchus okinawaensis]CAG9085262.1 unnamed protein product [Bursaphelenchus okinawaensis]